MTKKVVFTRIICKPSLLTRFVFVNVLMNTSCASWAQINPAELIDKQHQALIQEQLKQQQDRMDEQRRRQQEQQAERQTTFTELPLNTTPQASNNQSAPSPCFSIHTIYVHALPERFSNHSTGRQLKRSAINYINQQPKQCLNSDSLVDLQNALTNQLIEQGDLTSRIAIPNQNIATGQLTLDWQPGFVSKVQSSDHPIGLSSLLMPHQVNRIYNQRDTDQALENLKRLSSQSQATIDLKPAEQTNGTIVQYVLGKTAFKDRIHGSIGIDNSGSKDTGMYQSNASISIDSPLGVYDQLTMNLGSNANLNNKNYNNRSNGVYWDVPIGYFGLQLGATQSRYLQVLPGYVSDLSYTGKTREHFINLTYVAYRNSHSKGTFNAKLARKRSYSYIDGTEIDVQRKDYVYAELGWEHRYYRGNQQYTLGINYKTSLPRLSNSVGFIYGEPDWQGKFAVWSLNANASIPFTLGATQWRYSGTLKAQYGRRPLPGNEYFSIGSRYNVRGTDETYGLSAEDGLMIRNDLAYVYGQGLHQAYVGLDWGIVHGPSASSAQGRSMAGAVMGVKGYYKMLSYDFTMGYPIHRPKRVHQAGPQFTGSISLQF